RYIKYLKTGDEELYDHSNDEYEWKNVAADPAHVEVKKKLSAWFPKSEKPEVERKKPKAKKNENPKKNKNDAKQRNRPRKKKAQKTTP
ncbi:MAG: hypothetical protein AAF517_20750, partial [Planctomycetota bacterium]